MEWHTKYDVLSTKIRFQSLNWKLVKVDVKTYNGLDAQKNCLCLVYFLTMMFLIYVKVLKHLEFNFKRSILLRGIVYPFYIFFEIFMSNQCEILFAHSNNYPFKLKTTCLFLAPIQIDNTYFSSTLSN